MEISTRTSNDTHIVAIAGSMDSTTSPEAQKALDGVLAVASKVALDFTKLDYISSAGLRVLLGAAKTLLASRGSLGIFGLNPSVLSTNLPSKPVVGTSPAFVFLSLIF